MVDKKTANKFSNTKRKILFNQVDWVMKLIFDCSYGRRRKAYLVRMLGISNSESGTNIFLSSYHYQSLSI